MAVPRRRFGGGGHKRFESNAGRLPSGFNFRLHRVPPFESRGLVFLHEQAWQFRNVGRYASSFVHRENVGYIGIGFCLSPIHIGKRLPVSVLNFEATRSLLDGPGQRKAACRRGETGNGETGTRL